jgi:hypothetical protein
VNSRVFPIVVASALACAAATRTTVASISAQDHAAVRSLTWADLAPVRADLERQGITSAGFPSYLEHLRQTHAARMREGDLDHLVFYLLQSTRFTSLPAIEPALSAKALVDGLDAGERQMFLRDPQAALPRIAAPVRSRVDALCRALDSSSRDARLAYFRELANATFPDLRREGQREAALFREYLRVMAFIYEKEFVAQRSGPGAVAELYRSRGLSTDTAVEAGYLVYLGLGVVKSLEPDRRIRRVLIVGPGLDLAPRTALLEVGPPESYQPWAVMDALLSLELSRADDLEVVAADINPRVVEHLRRSRVEPPVLTLVSEIRESETVTLADEYRTYFTQLGRSIGDVSEGAPSVGGATGHLSKTVRIAPAAARVLGAETLDIVTERLDGTVFDLVIATNILPYFDDVELMMAMSNVAAMLARGGIFLHNEPRQVMGNVTAAVGLPFEQSRHAIIATAHGAPAPLFDSVWLHRRAQSP